MLKALTGNSAVQYGCERYTVFPDETDLNGMLSLTVSVKPRGWECRMDTDDRSLCTCARAGAGWYIA